MHPYDECLLHTPRLGVLYPPSFTDTRLILSILDQPRWYDADPEFVMVYPGVAQRSPVQHFLETTYRRHCGIAAHADDPHWCRAYREVNDYVTHLLVFMPRDDLCLQGFLKDPKREARPTKVVMV